MHGSIECVNAFQNLEIAFCNLVNFFQGYGFPGLPGPIGQKGEKGECKGNVSV